MSQIESLVSTLSNLQLGEKCWYWMCQDSTDQPLLMLPFTSAGGLRELMAKSKLLALPMGEGSGGGPEVLRPSWSLGPIVAYGTETLQRGGRCLQ